MLSKPWLIPVNQLLRGAEKSFSLDDLLSLSLMARAESGRVSGDKGSMLKNISKIEPEDLRRIQLRYGGHGLFQLVLLAQTQEPEEFDHFWSAARDQLVFLEILEGEELGALLPEPMQPTWDNTIIHTQIEISRFNHNVINARLSRQLYHPGRKLGYLVHGLGGPRILVSHPFRGCSNTGYDIYRNAVDVVTSLGARGWYGQFLFLDHIVGLEEPINGVPAWAVWFSQIAAHSDAVLFIKQHMGDFGPSQRLEMAFTPDRVNRKIVEIPADELTWAISEQTDLELINICPEGNLVSDDEFNCFLADSTHARTFLPLYCEEGFPRDWLIHIDENGAVSEYKESHTGYTT